MKFILVIIVHISIHYQINYKFRTESQLILFEGDTFRDRKSGTRVFLNRLIHAMLPSTSAIPHPCEYERRLFSSREPIKYYCAFYRHYLYAMLVIWLPYFSLIISPTLYEQCYCYHQLELRIPRVISHRKDGHQHVRFNAVQDAW